MTTDAAREPPALRVVVGVLTLVVFALVLVVLYAFPGRTAPGEPGVLPTLNALLNGSAGVFLLVGYAFIRRRHVRAHRACMLIAFGLSCLFLVTYLLHHAQVGSVKFHGQGVLRAAYLALLVPHVLLAGVVVPLALFTIYRGWTRRIEQHRRIARVTLPVWLFVSVSGVLVYVMLYHVGR